MYMENLCMPGSNKIDIEYVLKIRGNFNRIHNIQKTLVKFIPDP